MAIKDIQKKDKPGLSRAGVIRLGYKVKKCKKCKTANLAGLTKCHKCGNADFGPEYPTPADHFVLTDAPGVTEAIGTPKPKELRIYFPFNEIEQVFPAFHQYWVASALVCRGDGEHILYGIDPQKGDVIVRDGQALREFESSAPSGNVKFRPGDSVVCPGLSHHLYKKCEHCKPNAMLIVLLRDVPRLAYWQIATTSIHNIVRLTEQLTYIQQTIGRLQGVPFILKLKPEKISVPKSGGNGRMRTEKYLLSLEVDPEWVNRLMLAQSELSDPMRLAAEVPDEDDVIDVEPQSHPRRQSPPDDNYSRMEPPVWMPPNGNDDSTEVEVDDLAAFYDTVLERIPYYADTAHIEAALTELELVYDPENEEMIFDALAKMAESKADGKAASQEKLL